MKRFLLFIIILITGLTGYTQTVENIRVEPKDDKILVHYRIGGSTNAQIYDVKFSCSIDGGPKFEPKSVYGDVKENIRGGKSDYTIFWDVFKDLEEVGEAEFFIKVYLVKDESPTRIAAPVQPQDQQQTIPAQQKEPQATQNNTPPAAKKETFRRKSYFGYCGSGASPIGISFGGLRNFGVYFTGRYGANSNYYSTDVWLTVTGGLTKYIVTRGKYRLHAFAGIGRTAEIYEEYTYNTDWTKNYFTVDFGIIQVYNWVNVTLGLEVVKDNGVNPVIGLGFVF